MKMKSIGYIMWQRYFFIWLMKSVLFYMSANMINFPSTSGEGPQINQDEAHIISDGGTILLECRGKQNVTWVHTHINIPGQEYFTEEWLCSRNKTWPYCSTFELREAFTTDTGLYKCEYLDNSDLYDTTMVYVHNNTNSMAGPPDGVDGAVGSPLVIRCLPTLPNITLTLKNNGRNVTNDFSWDPAEGFIKDHATVTDSGNYKCKATENDNYIIILVTVSGSSKLVYPAFDDECDAEVYVAGMEFQLTCYVITSKNDFEFIWTLPNNSTKHDDKDKIWNDIDDRWESMMFIKNPTVEDSGTYACSVEGYLVRNGKTTEKQITVLDPCTAIEYVELNSLRDEFEINEGKDFDWRVEVKAFPPKPLLKYYLNNKLLHSNYKESCSLAEIFSIKNITHADFGILTLEAQTQRENTSYCRRGRNIKMVTKSISASLIVNSHPIIESLSAPPVIVEDGEKAVIAATCIVIAFPEPTISWYFEPNGHLPMDIGVNKTVETPRNKWKATFEYLSNISGNLRCEATNSFGDVSESVFVNITVSEAPEFLNKSIGKYTKVEVQWNADQWIDCSVRGHPAPNIFWYKDDILINTTQLEEIGQPDADNPQKLFLTNIQREDNEGTYKCVANNTKNEIQRSVEINVLDNVIITPVWTPGRRAGLAIVFVLIVIMILIIIRLFKKVRKEKEYKASMKQTRAYLFQQGNPEAINNDLTADEQAQFLPYDISWEIPRKDITQGQILGSGAFGQVLKALVKGLEEDGSSKTVALKMVKSTEDHSQVRALALELKIMIHLGKHLNIVNLVGAHTADIDRGELWIIVEFCKYGNLLVYMHKHQRVFINQIDPITDDINGSIIGSSSAGSPSVTEGLAGPSSGSMSPRSCMANPGYGLIVTEPSGTIKNITMEKEIQKTAVSPINGRRISSDPLLEGQPSQLKIINSDMSSTSYNRSVSNTAASPMSDIGLDTGGNPLFQDFGGNIPGKDGPFTTSDLVCWSWQVSQGMEYLAKRKVLHGDLAARNLLLTYNNVVKISDFGLSRDVYKKDVYMKKGDDLMPIKWMAIESIRDRIFSVQSDVWAYGVTLWEIFSLGSTPYPGTEVTPDFISLLERGKRMEQPRYGNRELYDIVLSCWEADPRQRPTFSQLTELVGELLNPDKKGVYMKMNDVYLQMNKEFFSERTDYLQMLASPDFTNNRQSTISLSPSTDQMVNNEYMKMGSNTEAAISNPGYFPMGSVRDSAAAVDNEQDIFSPRQPDENEQKFFANEEDEDNTEKSVENEWEIVDKEHEYVNLPKKKKDLIDF